MWEIEYEIHPLRAAEAGAGFHRGPTSILAPTAKTYALACTGGVPRPNHPRIAILCQNASSDLRFYAAFRLPRCLRQRPSTRRLLATQPAAVQNPGTCTRSWNRRGSVSTDE